MFDWNDLRVFLAVAESGSTLAAGRQLRVSQTTAARRIAALEQALGVKLFERRRAGYALTPVGEALVERARAVGEAAALFADAAAAEAREEGGVVRMTANEIYSVTLLPAILRDLRVAHPHIHIELDSSSEPRDLAAGAAEIALRSAAAPTGGGLVGRRIAPDPWTVYCSRQYADERGMPRSMEALRDHALIGGGGDGVWPIYQAWLRRYGLEGAVAIHQGSMMGLLAAVRAGIGLAALPSFVADRDPDLVRCLPPSKEDAMSLWLLTHERLRHVPRIRLVLDFVYDRLRSFARE